MVLDDTPCVAPEICGVLYLFEYLVKHNVFCDVYTKVGRKYVSYKIESSKQF